jgi:hypothetical protein
MSTITSYDDALDFYPQAARIGRPSAFATLRAAWQALCDGLEASRRYHEQTGCGVPHERAVKAALGALDRPR